MQQAQTIYEKETKGGLTLTKKSWELFSEQEKDSIINLIKDHKHDGFFGSPWRILGRTNRKTIYCCGICGQFKRDKNFIPYLYDEDE